MCNILFVFKPSEEPPVEECNTSSCFEFQNASVQQTGLMKRHTRTYTWTSSIPFYLPTPNLLTTLLRDNSWMSFREAIHKEIL